MCRNPALFLFFLCSFLSGCLVDGVKKESTADTQKPSPSNSEFFHISGRMITGVADEATVYVYPYLSGAMSSRPVVEVVTDVDGYYEAYIPREYIGKPALIRASNPSRIKCALVNGCGGEAFGAWSSLEEDVWILDIAVPELDEQGIYNGTALTHLGFSLVESSLSGIDLAENNTADIAVKTRMQSSNSRVTSALGLVGNLPSLKVFDITNPADYQSATPLEMRYSLLNSAVIASATSIFDEPDQFLALSKLSDQFVEVGISGQSVSGSKEVTQINLLESLANTFQYLQDSTEQDFTVEISEVLTLRNLFLNEEAGQYSRGTSSESATLTSIERGKRMLSSVREVAFSLDLRKLAQFSNLATFTSGEAADALEGFGVVLDTSEVLQGEKTDRLMVAFGSISRGVIEILTLYYKDQPVPDVVNGVRIEHVGSPRRHIFEIRDSINVCNEEYETTDCNVPVDLSMTMDVSYFGGNLGVSVVVMDDLNLSLAGIVGDDNHRLIFPGSASSFKAKQLFLQEGLDNIEEKVLVEVNDWALDMPFSIVSSADEIAASVSGVLDGSGSRLGATLEDQESIISESDMEIQSVVTSLLGFYAVKGFSLNASISINVNPEDQFFAAFNIRQSARPFEGNAVYKTSYRKLCMKTHAECSKHDEASSLEGETEENFMRLSASAAYKASLKGVNSPVLIQITGSRDSPNVNSVNNLKATYPGHALALNGRFNNNGGIVALDAVNLDGMHLYFESINGKRAGAVETPSKEKVADIVDMGQWVKVQYLNGDFESF